MTIRLNQPRRYAESFRLAKHSASRKLSMTLLEFLLIPTIILLYHFVYLFLNNRSDSENSKNGKNSKNSENGENGKNSENSENRYL